MKLFLIIIVVAATVLPVVVFSQSDPLDLFGTVENESEIKPGENIEEKIRNNFF